MKLELEEKLFELGKDFIHPDPQLQRNLMAFGFECGDGWYDLLYKLISDIKDVEPPKNFEIVQVKEKFGELRFYTYNSTEIIDQLIETAENDSVTICERCGADAMVQRIQGWYAAICDECRRELDK